MNEGAVRGGGHPYYALPSDIVECTLKSTGPPSESFNGVPPIVSPLLDATGRRHYSLLALSISGEPASNQDVSGQSE